MTLFRKRKPKWKKDQLSDVLKDGSFNVLVSTHNYHKVYNLLADTYLLLLQCEKVFNQHSNPEIIFPGFFFIRTRAAYIASIRLILAGQPVEAQTTLRLMIEDCWYGLFILNDPSPPRRRKIWVYRNDSDKSKNDCRKLFTVANVRKDHEKSDPITAKELNKLYNHTIDFGAHPNSFGVISQISQRKDDANFVFDIGIYSHDKHINMMSLRIAVAICVGYIKIIEKEFPDGFNEFVDSNLFDDTLKALNTIFKKWISQNEYIE